MLASLIKIINHTHTHTQSVVIYQESMKTVISNSVNFLNSINFKTKEITVLSFFVLWLLSPAFNSVTGYFVVGFKNKKKLKPP